MIQKKKLIAIIIPIIIIPNLIVGIYFAAKIPNISKWTFEIGDAIFVPNSPNVPRYEFFPDGHISVLPDGEGNWLMFWAGSDSFRTIGITPFPEEHFTLSPNSSVIGGILDIDSWKNGGLWLYSVHRINGSHLIGFIHAEDHWFPRNEKAIAWRSIAVSHSYDNGISWSECEQIITSYVPKPETPSWGGAGDFCVIWDSNNSRWMCFYAERYEPKGYLIHMAMTTDSNGTPGTWKKWDGTDFTSNGLGGKGKPIQVISNHPGSNPSISWNTYLQKWLITWQGRNGKIFISGSDDLIHWKECQLAINHGTNRIVWYPTFISEDGDTKIGQSGYIYYGDFAEDRSSRIFFKRQIFFYLNS